MTSSILTDDEREIFLSKVEETRQQYGPLLAAFPEEAQMLALYVFNMALDSEGYDGIETGLEAGAGAVGLKALFDTGSEEIARRVTQVAYAFLLIWLAETTIDIYDEAAAEVVNEAEGITAQAV